MPGRLQSPAARAPGAGNNRLRERQVRAARGRLPGRLRQLQRQRQHRLRNRSVDQRHLRVLRLRLPLPGRDLRSVRRRRSSARLPAPRPASPSAAFSASICRPTPTTAGRAGTGAHLPNADVACQGGKCVFLSCNDPQFLDCNRRSRVRNRDRQHHRLWRLRRSGVHHRQHAVHLWRRRKLRRCRVRRRVRQLQYRQPRLRDGVRVTACERRLPSALRRHDGDRHPALQQRSHRDRARRIVLPGRHLHGRGRLRSVQQPRRPDRERPRRLRHQVQRRRRATLGRRPSPDAATSSSTAWRSRPRATSSPVASTCDTVDFDPGAGTDLHFTATPEHDDAYVVELAPNGTLVWARTFAGARAPSVRRRRRHRQHGCGLRERIVPAARWTSILVAGCRLALGGADQRLRRQADRREEISSGRTCSTTALARPTLVSVAVAKDGNVWATGNAVAGVGCTIPPVPPPARTTRSATCSSCASAPPATRSRCEPSATLRNDDGVALAASPDGSMYLGGDRERRDRVRSGPAGDPSMARHQRRRQLRAQAQRRRRADLGPPAEQSRI